MKKPKAKPVFKYEKHEWYTNKLIGKQVCWQCGLIALNNPASDWCVQKGCNYAEDAGYEGKMKQLTKQFEF